MLELIERATAADLLTDAQLRESLPKRTNTVKGYLRTFVKNEALLARIDAYAQSWSRMFCHGSYLLNLRAMDLFGGRLGDEGPVELFVPAPPDDLVQGFFNLLQRDACKHAFLPDAWAVEDDEVVGDDDAEEDEGDDDAEEAEDDEEVGDDAGPSAPPVAVPVVAAVSFATLDPDIRQTVELHAGDLAHLVPPDWRTVLSGTAKWKSNALNFMKQQYDVAVKNHVLIHLKTRVVAYLLALSGLTADAVYPVKGIMKFPLRPYRRFAAYWAPLPGTRDRTRTAFFLANRYDDMHASARGVAPHDHPPRQPRRVQGVRGHDAARFQRRLPEAR